MPFADPEKNRSYQRDYKRLQRAGGCQTPGQTRLPVEFRWQTAADVLALLDEQVAAVRQDASLGSVERAKGVGSLAGIALRAIDAGDVAARVEALESILKSRPKQRDAALRPLPGGFKRFFPGRGVGCGLRKVDPVKFAWNPFFRRVSNPVPLPTHDSWKGQFYGIGSSDVGRAKRG